MLVYDEKVPRHFWRIATVTGVLPSRDSDAKRSDSVLVYDEKVPRHFWRIATVTGVLPSRDSDAKRSDSVD